MRYGEELPKRLCVESPELLGSAQLSLELLDSVGTFAEVSPDRRIERRFRLLESGLGPPQLGDLRVPRMCVGF